MQAVTKKKMMQILSATGCLKVAIRKRSEISSESPEQRNVQYKILLSNKEIWHKSSH
jgi:hypothetical protein